MTNKKASNATKSANGAHTLSTTLQHLTPSKVQAAVKQFDLLPKFELKKFPEFLAIKHIDIKQLNTIIFVGKSHAKGQLCFLDVTNSALTDHDFFIDFDKKTNKIQFLTIEIIFAHGQIINVTQSMKDEALTLLTQIKLQSNLKKEVNHE